MSTLEIVIEDTRTGNVESRFVDNLEQRCSRETGVSIGSAADCDVCLPDPAVTAHHARWYPGGYHRFVLVLDEDAVVTAASGDEYRGGDTLRVDQRSFRIGPYVLTIQV
ncbi:hypothetical protein FJV41_32835 [Myxococcus llanfairpwllgwyngyllgogerychwyrndrobwllllantysiliogogogochensis]|uniref:FHA domain-containing protein n=1 Tax=Myxococcus llanfairpwllgwyngyllgogerychwyrndrobwllllantysiliogogogochensis TaxID=2590453 RepID=A0A540WRT4_9BACT|nr:MULTISPECIES: hypothetical protein [Myxococcus]NTX55646.1 hypothetical protein [Myxococcus sp. CA039A]TQF11703.1 hypothetical protein FJV41_32835 [Myxococcus llanfairpwllgwyngyllgogerychwyrndrobwllllantysiliogogogochensis]